MFVSGQRCWVTNLTGPVGPERPGSSRKRCEGLFVSSPLTTVCNVNTGARISEAMVESNFIEEDDVGFYWVHAGDIHPTCQKVLKGFSEKHRPHHITTDLCERLPSPVRTCLE